MSTPHISPISKSASRLAALSPQKKVALMLGSDALLLPGCMLMAMALRLGSVEAALETTPWLQVGVALLALPALQIAASTAPSSATSTCASSSPRAPRSPRSCSSSAAWPGHSRSAPCRARCCRSSGSSPSPTSSPRASSPARCCGAA
jgi:hypothetical protein